jgi:hypothetical protein
MMREASFWLSTLSEKERRGWSEHAWEFQLKLNSALFKPFKGSRLEALAGYQPKIPVSWYTTSAQPAPSARGSTVRDARGPKLSSYEKQQETVAKAFDKRTGAAPVTLVPGDLVLVEIHKPIRYGDKFKGPFSVLKVDHSRNRATVSTVGGAAKDVHLRRLKEWTPPSLDADDLFDEEDKVKSQLDFGPPSPPPRQSTPGHEEAAANALLTYDPSKRVSRRGPQMLGVEYAGTAGIKRIGGHRRNSHTGRLEVKVTEWDSGASAPDMWLPLLTTATTPVGPLKSYIEETNMDYDAEKEESREDIPVDPDPDVQL